MTITITLTAEIGSASGVDFNADFTSYFSGLVPTGWPYILGGSGQFDGDQIVLFDKVEEGSESDTRTIILDGEDFNYYFNDHTLSGTLTTVRLSTLGDSYNSSDGSFDMEDGHITNVTTPIEISGLDISNPYGERGDLHEVIYGLMGGAHDGGGVSKPAPLEAFLWAEGHNVVGSTGADKYGGTAYADTIRGNGGNDVLDGKGGKDTAVFSGTKASYTLTKNANGSITVKDNRAGKDGTDTLKNIETARFSNGTVDLTALTTVNKAPTSVALTKAKVAENTKVGTTVGTFSAVDPEGKALTYKLTDTAGGLFKLSGSKLQVAKAIDYEKVQSDKVTVEVSDGVNKTTKTFTIAITDVLEAIKGSAASETIKGGIGADKIVGGSGNDKIYGLDGKDQLFGDAGNDTLIGGSSADKLDGGAGSDTLSGDSGNDTLYGGAGADDLTGGTGADTFVFKAASDTTTAAAGRDTIFDFDGAAGDRIDLSAIDADSTLSSDQAFTYLGKGDFTGKAGELRYSKQTSDTYIYGDIDGDAKADFAIHLDDAITLSKGYFVL